MKNLFFFMALACFSMKGVSQTQHKLADGLYLIAEVVNDSNAQKPSNKTAFIRFDPLLLENAPDKAQALLVYPDKFVPLELLKEPELLDQTDGGKKIQLSFSKRAADKLEKFTSENLMKQVTLIVNGQALTANKIRAAITGGKMEITRCGDNACKKIYLELKDNIK